MAQEKPTPEKATILDHLHHITRRWGEIGKPVLLETVFLSAADRAEVKNVAHFRFPDQIEDAADHIAGMNPHSINAYVTVNPVDADNRPPIGKRASAEHIAATFFHWADADSAEAAENIRQFVGPKPTFVVITGTEPFPRPHVYWELDTPTADFEAWTRTQRNIAATLKTDASVIDPPRIMRVAGTVNWPKPQKAAKGYTAEVTKLTIHDPSRRPPVSTENMARAFARTDSPAQPVAGATGWIDLGDRPATSVDVYSDILRRAQTDGEKHAGVRDMTAKMAAAGVPRNMTEAMVRQVCPIWDANVEALIETAYAKYYHAPEIPVLNDEAPANPVGLEWFRDVQAALTDSYLIKGFLAQGAMSVIYGPSNSGKTFFALDLAYALACGAAWRGLRVRQSAILYLAAEGGRGVQNRLAALKVEHGASDIPLTLRRAGMDLLRAEADLQAVYDLARTVQGECNDLPLVIVIDTLSRVMAGGDENSAADMTALIRNIDAIRERTGAHIMLVHHTGKDAARGARGHSSLRAATDTEIEVQATEDDEGQLVRAAMVTKQRDYQGGETFAFALKGVTLGTDQDGDEVTSCVVIDAEADDFHSAKKARKGLGGNQKIIADTFDQMLGEGMGKPNPGGLGMPEPGRFWCVKMDDLRTAARGKMVATDTRSAFNQAMKALTGERGLFCMAGEIVWRTDRKVK